MYIMKGHGCIYDIHINNMDGTATAR